MPAQPPRRYRFEDLVLDANQRRLSRGDAEIRLTKLSFDFLLTLVEAAPNLLTHDQLAESVWGRRRVVTSENLSQRIAVLRHALGDDAEHPRYIEVVRGQGYRLIPRVERVGSDDAVLARDAPVPPATHGSDQPAAAPGLDARTPASRRSAPYRVVAGVALVTLVAAIASAFLWRPPRSAGPIEYDVGRSTRLLLERELELDPALSPDGRLIAYAAGPIGRTQIFVRQVAGGSAVNLTGQLPGAHRWPRWSPDGTQIAFITQSPRADDSLHLIPALGGTARVLVRARDLAGHAWSPDGAQIVYASMGRLSKLPTAGGEPTLLVEAFEVNSPSWSPDGSRIAFVAGNGLFALGLEALANIAPSSIWIVPPSGGTAVSVTDDAALNVNPVWTPDSASLLAISDRDGSRDLYQLFLPVPGSPAVPPRRLTVGLNVHSLDWSTANDTFAYSVFTSRTNIWTVPIPPTWPVTPESARAITSGNQTIETLNVSPDGTWLAFDSNRAGNQDIYKIRTNGEDLIRLTDHPSDDFFPSWSPDGKYVAFHSFRNGNRDLFLVSADGGPAQQLTFSPAQERMPDWSPDGERIVFWSDETGRLELYVLSRTPDGSGWTRPTQLTVDGGGWGRWSPTGEWIAYLPAASGQHAQLAVISPNGGTPRIFELGPDVAASYPAWAKDGSKIFWKARALDGTSSLWSTEIADGTVLEVMRFDRLSPSGYDRMEFAVDDANFYFPLSERESDIWIAELVESESRAP